MLLVMKRLIVSVPEEMLNKLDEAASRLGVKKSTMAKIAIDEYLKKNGERI